MIVKNRIGRVECRDLCGLFNMLFFINYFLIFCIFFKWWLGEIKDVYCFVCVEKIGLI